MHLSAQEGYIIEMIEIFGYISIALVPMLPRTSSKHSLCSHFQRKKSPITPNRRTHQAEADQSRLDILVQSNASIISIMH